MVRKLSGNSKLFYAQPQSFFPLHGERAQKRHAAASSERRLGCHCVSARLQRDFYNLDSLFRVILQRAPARSESLLWETFRRVRWCSDAAQQRDM